MLEDNPDKETLDTHAYDQDNDKGSGSGKTEKDLPPRDQETPPPSRGEQSDGNQGQPDEQQQAGASAPPPLSPDERETLNIQWQQRMAGAAQQAMQVGKLGGSLARMIDHLLQPQLPWRMLLARYLSNSARDDYSYMRPSRREGDYILPSLRSHQIDLVVALDTSGSVKDREFAEFVAEINALKGQLRARVTLLACDAALAEGAPWVFEPWEEFRLPDAFKGGGGTSFTPVFDWVEQQAMHPQSLIYFTDAEGEFPEQEPAYPVLWLIKGKNPVPWGQRIQLN
jgi:predicted metal-dependent peptidase